MEDTFQTSVCIPGAVLVVAFCVTAVALNILLLIVLWKDPTKSLRSTTTVYIASLSVLHIAYGIIAGSVAAQSYIACAMGDEGTPHLEKEFSRICFTCFVRVENFLLLAFAVERLGNTAFPAFYQQGRYKAKNALFCIGCIVLYSFCFSIFDMIAGKFWVRQLDVHLNNVIPLLATVVLTALLYNSLRKQSILRTENNNCNGALREETETIRKSRVKKQISLAKGFVLIALLFVVSLTTYFALSLYEVYCSSCWKREWFFAALRCSIAISFLHVAIIPIIYYACVPKFRRGFKMVFCGKHHQEQIGLKPLKRRNNNTVPVIYL